MVKRLRNVVKNNVRKLIYAKINICTLIIAKISQPTSVKWTVFILKAVEKIDISNEKSVFFTSDGV